MHVKNCMLAAVAILVIGTCGVEKVAAQVSPQNGWNPAMFNNRTVGQPLAPRSSTMFGGGIQPSPGGTFVYVGRSGSGAFTTPWQRGAAGAFELPGQLVVAPAINLQAAPLAQPLAPMYSPPQLPSAVEIVPVMVPGVNQQEEANSAEQGVDSTEPAINPAGQGLEAAPAMPPAFSTVVIPSARMRAATASAAAQPYNRSPELSERLTRIARDKGMLSSRGIDVYLGNRVARLQGIVRTAGDRDLLANVVGLEPEVQAIDNRLVVEGAAAVSSK